jgi:hypothetical protein
VAIRGFEVFFTAEGIPLALARFVVNQGNRQTKLGGFDLARLVQFQVFTQIVGAADVEAEILVRKQHIHVMHRLFHGPSIQEMEIILLTLPRRSLPPAHLNS